MTIPYCITGSLCSTFVSDQLVGFSVKQNFIITRQFRIKIQIKLPIKRPRYFLEDNRPSQTNNHTSFKIVKCYLN